MPPIVVAVDFSEPSRKAFKAAVQLAGDLGEPLVLVHAFTPAPKGAGGHRGPVGDAKAEIEAQDWQKESMAWVKEAGKSVKVDAVGRPGKPAEVVLAEAKARKARLIVVGSHGRTGLKRAVMGSVAEAVVRESRLPVVVVPSDL